eukprot:COSAG01_NODE_1263_length_10996_cov_70.459117_1_plen_90_part_00
MFSRRFRGSCRNPDEVHGTLMARRQFPIHFSVGTDPDKKTLTFPRDRPTNKDKGQLYRYRYSCTISRYNCTALHKRYRVQYVYDDYDYT